MLHMMEIVGTSPQSFAEAVRAAVAEITRLGKKAHFFQVVEQRGSVREGEVKEFQVVLKVAVEG
ncbi:MAG: dodecin domain-containing protein [Candidatus Aminicenantes bacterium]|nr:dodecin domain-containing protein [Candidatus Aminicenantes bacterium]